MADALVECYSGHTYAQEPRTVLWRGRRYPVTRVERRWRTPEGPAFRVQTEADVLFEVTYRELEDAWVICALSPGEDDHDEDEEVQI